VIHARLLTAVLVLLLSVGCASAKLTVLQPLPDRQDQLRVHVAASPQARINERDIGSFEQILTNRLASWGFRVEPGSGGGVRAVDGTVEHYEPGSRMLRWFFGWLGIGRGSVDSSWTVLDASGARIGACRIEGRQSMGVFGGHFDETLQKAADRLAEFLRAQP